MNRTIGFLTLLLVLISTLGVLILSCEKEIPELESEVTSIELIAGANQTEKVSTTLSNKVTVVVKDQKGNEFNKGTVIKFAVTEGSVSPTNVTTDASGKASVTWTLGTTEGIQTLEVTAFSSDGITALNGSPLQVAAMATAIISITVNDVDGNTYQAIKLGEQVWMAKNLRVTHYANGKEIPFIINNFLWANLEDNNTDKAYSYYNNNSVNIDTYGILYTWTAAMNGQSSSSSNPSGIQGVCPTGWHLPSDIEWKELEMYLGMNTVDADGTGWRGTDEGDKLKETGTTHWLSPNTSATNISGFGARPSGGRGGDTGGFYGLGATGRWWSTTEFNNTYTWYRGLSYLNSEVYRDGYYKSSGFSVRCIKD